MRSATGSWYVGIIDENCREMTTPSQRQLLVFRPSAADTCANVSDHVFVGLLGTAATVGICRDTWTMQVDITCNLQNKVCITAGCELRLAAGSLQISDSIVGVPRQTVQVMSSMEEWLATPEMVGMQPTAQQIWDAAFVAGHSTAYTLMTGDNP